MQKSLKISKYFYEIRDKKGKLIKEGFAPHDDIFIRLTVEISNDREITFYDITKKKYVSLSIPPKCACECDCKYCCGCDEGDIGTCRCLIECKCVCQWGCTTREIECCLCIL